MSFGEVDGHVDARTEAVARVVESAPGLTSEIRTDMDVWLKYHVAPLFPTLGPCLHAAGLDNYRMARTRDLLVLAIRGIREAFRVLESMGLPVTPGKFRMLQWVPEPILILLAARMLSNPMMETALVRHAAAAHDEVQHLIGEFMALARTTTVSTPVIDYLITFYGPNAPEVPEGSAEIPLHWSGMLALVSGLVVSASALAALVRACGRRRRQDRGCGRSRIAGAIVHPAKVAGILS